MLKVSLLLIFIATIVGLSRVAAQEQTIPGLCVSTLSVGQPQCDVILNGVLQTKWQNAPDYAATDLPQFYATINLNVPSAAPTWMEVTYGFDNNGGGSVGEWIVDPWNPQVQTEATTVGSADVFFNGTIICGSQGWSFFSITLSFPASPKPYDSIVINFNKQCVFPLMGLGTVAAPNQLPPFDSNVIAANQMNASFASFVQTAPVMDFYPFLEPAQSDPLLSVQAVSLVLGSDPTQLRVEPMGEIGWNGYAFQDTVYPISVRFTCLIPSTAPATDLPVFGSLSFGWNGTLTFSFSFRCNP